MTEQAEMRELLEFAALAAHAKDFVSLCDTPGPCRIISASGNWEEFNPHTDDGDSRRLQVALGIECGPSLVSKTPEWWAYQSGVIGKGDVTEELVEVTNGDSPAAARLAVLKVAAEIGRRMKAWPEGYLPSTWTSTLAAAPAPQMPELPEAVAWRKIRESARPIVAGDEETASEWRFLDRTVEDLFTEAQLIAYAQQYAAANPELAELRRVAGILKQACKTAIYQLKGREHDEFLRVAIAAAEAAGVK